VYSSSGIHKSRLSSLRFPDLCWLDHLWLSKALCTAWHQFSIFIGLFSHMAWQWRLLSEWLGVDDFFIGLVLSVCFRVWSSWPFPATFIVLLYVYFAVYISSKLGCNISISLLYKLFLLLLFVVSHWAGSFVLNLGIFSPVIFMVDFPHCCLR